jgi:hypothetical protein
MKRTYDPNLTVASATYYKRAEDCPDAVKHTKSPPGYLQWHAWAENKAKTHTQHRCPKCGFWVIWKRKRKAAA